MQNTLPAYHRYGGIDSSQEVLLAAHVIRTCTYLITQAKEAFSLGKKKAKVANDVLKVA